MNDDILDVREEPVAAGADVLDLGIIPPANVVKSTEFSVLCYSHTATDAQRTWMGNDRAEAYRHVGIMRARYPMCVVRLTESTYYHPIGDGK